MQDIDWLVKQNLLDIPCVTAGWSFGATLAFIASQYLTNVKGVVIGGTLANLRNHRIRANLEDPIYEKWFTERFGPQGAYNHCESFLDLKNHMIKPLKFIRRLRHLLLADLIFRLR